MKKSEIKNIELLPLIYHLKIENKEWITQDAINDLRSKYIIGPNRDKAIITAYSRWKKNNNQFEINNFNSLIKYISTENVKEFVKKNRQIKDFASLDDRYEHPKNPLGSDSRKILKAIRAMLLDSIN